MNTTSNIIQELWFFLKLSLNESDEPCIFVLFLVDKLKLFYVILDNLIDGEGGTPDKVVLSVIIVVPAFDDNRHIVVTVAEFLGFNRDPIKLWVEIIFHFFSFKNLYRLHIFTRAHKHQEWTRFAPETQIFEFSAIHFQEDFVVAHSNFLSP